MEIKSSALKKDIFTNSNFNYRATFMSSFNGQGYKIKVVSDTDQPSQSLFQRIN